MWDNKIYYQILTDISIIMRSIADLQYTNSRLDNQMQTSEAG